MELKPIMNAPKDCAQRFSGWVDSAIWYYEQGLMDDAEICAYEAGCYSGMNVSLEMPATIAENAFLKQHFERGAVEAPQDAENQEWAASITDAGFDPWNSTRSTRQKPRSGASLAM